MKWLVMFCVIPALVISCGKVVDFKRHHPGVDEHFCKIKKFIFRDFDITGMPGPSRELSVSYDLRGNPISVIPTRGWSYPYYVMRFTYGDDVAQELLEYRLDGVGGPAPTDSIFIYRHRYLYGYSPANTIIDSDYELTPNYGVANLINLDSAHRIIHREYTTYVYNGDGNMVSNNDITGWPGITYVYDDKINWRQTHRTWQFIDYNFSRNNAIDPSGVNKINGYNLYGLPLQFRQTYRNGAQIFTTAYYYEIMDIQYDCDPGAGPGGHGY